MKSREIRIYEYKSDSKSDKLACLVAGFNGKISSYRSAIKALNSAGYDVVAYDYDVTILSDGNASKLIMLIDEITDSVREHSDDYSEVLCTGVSLGAYIAFNVQRRLPKAYKGVYGTAGIAVSHAIFTARAFSSVRKAFESKGYTEKTLLEVWKDIEILDDPSIDSSKSLIIVLGKIDRIVRFKTASTIMKIWQQNGTRVHFFGIRGLGHVTTIAWYKRNLRKLLDLQ